MREEAPLRIRELAESKGLNILHLAQQSGVGYTTVLNYWHERVKLVNWRVLASMGKVLGVQPRELIREVDLDDIDFDG